MHRVRVLKDGSVRFLPYINVKYLGLIKQISLGSYPTESKAEEIFEKYSRLFSTADSEKNIRGYLDSKKSNFYKYKEDYVVVETSKGSFTISKSDETLCRKHTWYFCGGYPCTKIKNIRVFLPNFLLPHSDGYCVDHIDRDKTNNTRENLRVIPKYQNMFNKSQYSNSKYGNGIVFREESGKYVVRIGYRGHLIYVGSYSCLEDAKIARKSAEKVVHKIDG